MTKSHIDRYENYARIIEQAKWLFDEYFTIMSKKMSSKKSSRQQIIIRKLKVIKNEVKQKHYKYYINEKNKNRVVKELHLLW